MGVVSVDGGADTPVRYPRTIASSGTTRALRTSIVRPASCAACARTAGGMASTSAVTRWFGMMSTRRANQKREMSVRTRPLSGMPCVRVCVSRCRPMRAMGRTDVAQDDIVRGDAVGRDEEQVRVVVGERVDVAHLPA